MTGLGLSSFPAFQFWKAGLSIKFANAILNLPDTSQTARRLNIDDR
jgi:hypothetical protein